MAAPSGSTCQIVPVADDSGWYTHRVSIQRETTERRRLEEGLRDRAAAAEELARLRSDFVASVSHELRTPLTAILGFAELLEGHWDELSEVRRRRQVRHIASSATRQLRLVEDLLPAGRLAGKALVPRRQRILLAPLIQQAATEVRGSYPRQRIDLSGPEDLAVLADPGRVVQIAVNLLDNAAKYSPEGSSVSARWGREGDVAALWMRDLGPGLPEAGRAALFSRFGRLPGSRPRGGRVGTGLGLYLGRQLAQAMDGSLDLEESGPAGSTFRLCFRKAEGA